jgi:hypothetical protein
LVHARGASKGVGEPAINSNNHPFTSSDKSLGLIHNGRVDDSEYNALKQKFEVKSNCDSEILLRIIENSENFDLDLSNEFYPHRLSGIKDVFSLINEGHMAVALGERGNDGDRMLWLFRNQYRPIWLVDMRELLGQIFFFSEPNIWEEAVNECGNFKSSIKSQKLIEIPHGQIWFFRTTDNEQNPISVSKFEAVKENTQPWQFDGGRFELKTNEPRFNVITELNELEELKINKKEQKLKFIENDLRLDFVDIKCNEIIDVVNNIRQYAEQLVQEQSINKMEFDELLVDLEFKRQELESMSEIIKR